MTRLLSLGIERNTADRYVICALEASMSDLTVKAAFGAECAMLVGADCYDRDVDPVTDGDWPTGTIRAAGLAPIPPTPPLRCSTRVCREWSAEPVRVPGPGGR